MRDSLPSLLKTVSDNVQRLRAETGRTQRVAAGNHVSQKTVSNLDTMGVKPPKKGPTLGTLHGYSEQFNLPTYQLLISNLPESSERRKQVDRMIRAFVDATPQQQDWLITTMEMMGQIGPTPPRKP